MAVIEWVAVGTPIVAMVGMFGMMLKVLGGLNKRFDDLNNRFDDLNKRFDDLKDSLNKRIDDLAVSVDKRIDDLAVGLNKRIDDLAVGLNKRIDDLAVEVKDMRQDVRSIDKRMVHLEGRMDSLDGLQRKDPGAVEPVRVSGVVESPLSQPPPWPQEEAETGATAR